MGKKDEKGGFHHKKMGVWWKLQPLIFLANLRWYDSNFTRVEDISLVSFVNQQTQLGSHQ